MTRIHDRVAFVDDDDMLRVANMQTLSLAGIEVDGFSEAAPALAALDAAYSGVVVTDVRMPGMDGLQFFARLRALDPELPVILITGHADVPMAISALKDGAWDFLTKPFSAEQLLASVGRALTARRLVIENRALKAAADRAAEGDPLIGETPIMADLRARLREIAASDVDVLIEGETGTGKELVATLIHRRSARRAKPFVTFHAAALPPSLAHSELVGHRDGVVPGLRLSRIGRIEAAQGGTLFLDALDSTPAPLQSALLRVIEEREVVPLGGDEARQVDIRVVAAIAREAEALVRDGLLRPDLLYRLDAARLRIPPLRERRQDVPLLFAHLLREAAERHRRVLPSIGAATHHHLLYHQWPGNVRELAQYAERFVLNLPAAKAGTEDHLPSLSERVTLFEAEEIRAALSRHTGDVRTVLAELGLPRKTFYDKTSRYGLNPAQFRSKKRD